jgi:hypothetical protein
MDQYKVAMILDINLFPEAVQEFNAEALAISHIHYNILQLSINLMIKKYITGKLTVN